MRKLDLLVFAAASALAFGCGDSDGGGDGDAGMPDGGGGGTGGGFTCGTGTIEQDGECVSDPGMRLDCGEGTFEHMGECVAVDPDDSTAPTTTAEPMGGRYLNLPAKVTLTTDEPAKIYYTTDGSDPDTSSDFQPSPAVIAPITDGMEIRYFAVDPAGNEEDAQSDTYEHVVTPPSPVTNVQVSMDGNDATITWDLPGDADGVVIVQLGGGDVMAPETGESYEEGDSLGGGTVVYVGSAEEFVAENLDPGVASWLIYAYNDVMRYSGGVVARSGEVPLPAQTGELTVDVADTSVSVGTKPADLNVTASNVEWDGVNNRVSVDVTVKNNANRAIFLPKLIVKDAALSGGGTAGLFNSDGDFPDTVGEVEGTVDVTGLTLPDDVNTDTLQLFAGNGIQNLDFTDPEFTGTTPASLISYINANSTGLTASLNSDDEVVITAHAPGSTNYTYVTNSGVGTTLGFNGVSDYGTDLQFRYVCPKDPDADDPTLIESTTKCMRALRPGESATSTFTFDSVASDSVITVDFEITGNRAVLGGSDWYSNPPNPGQALNTYIPIFDMRANQATGFLVNDPLLQGPGESLRTSAFILAPDGRHVHIGSRVSLHVSTYDIETSRVVGGATLENGRGHVNDMVLANDGYLYALLNLQQHEYRWSSANYVHTTSEAVVLRLDPNTLEELARAHVVLKKPDFKAPAVDTGSVDLTTLTFPGDVTGTTLEVSVNGEDPQTIDFDSPSFTGTTPANLATFINTNSTGIVASVNDSNQLVIETEASGEDESFQFSAVGSYLTLGLDASIHKGDATATYEQNSDSYAPRVKRMDVSEDASMLAFGVTQEAESIQGVELDTGEVWVLDLATMEFVDYDDGMDGVQPVYLPESAIDPDDTNLDEVQVGPNNMAFSANGETLVVGGDDQVGTDVYAIALVDVESGDFELVDIETGAGWSDTVKYVYRSPAGKVYALTWREIIEVNPSNGDLTYLNNTDGGSRWLSAVHPGPNGNVYVKDYYQGMFEMSPDWTILYDSDHACASGTTNDTCNQNRDNYGKSVTSSLY